MGKKVDNYRKDKDIAIIGIAIRFPGANNIEEFWNNLINGKESISFYSKEELLGLGIDPAIINNENYIRASSKIDKIEYFDAEFFGYNPDEASRIDPQSRLFLECAWEAMENSGYSTDKYDGNIGVFGGYYISNYLIKNMVHSTFERMRQENEFYHVYQCTSDFLTTNVAYKLNLNGPSVSVQSWCTTSLSAIHMACLNLRQESCNMALAGAVYLRSPQEGYFYSESGTESPDGHCRSFDHKAKGTVLGSGLGIVVLKKLDEAIKDRDNIYAIIKGSSINNDGAGRQKLSYFGSTVDGQYRAIVQALKDAGTTAENITYVEAHGGSSELADRLELQALSKAFKEQTSKTQFCGIGSVKPNIGNLVNAAGMASLVKTVLSLNHKMLPPIINFEKLNPKNDLSKSPFYINNTLKPWSSDGGPLMASINNFGVGGTNVNFILQEAPVIETIQNQKNYHLLTFSAKTEKALDEILKNNFNHLKNVDDSVFSDVAYTLNIGRKDFDYRKFIVCKNRNEAIEILEKNNSKKIHFNRFTNNSKQIAFMFPGYGDQYVDMGRELFENELIFRKNIEECAAIIEKYLDIKILPVLYPDIRQEKDAYDKMQNLSYGLTSLFAFEYSLAKLFIELNVKPQFMIGCSIGEIVAACIAEVFSLDDALGMVSELIKNVEKLPKGKMLAVPLSEEELQYYLNDNISLAVVNGPNACIVSGKTEAIVEIEYKLKQKNIVCLPVNSTHAFHSEMMVPAVNELAEFNKRITFSNPKIPFISSISGKWITDSEATNPGYWISIATVRFNEAIQVLLQEQDVLTIELGPKQTLSQLAQLHKDKYKEFKNISIFSYRNQNIYSETFYNCIGKLWLYGVKINWEKLNDGEQRKRIPLPTYPFERKRYWIEQSYELQTETATDTEKWFYIPVWKRINKIRISHLEKLIKEKLSWLIFDDLNVIGTEISRILRQAGQVVILVKPGKFYSHNNDNTYEINPENSQEYEKLIKSLSDDQALPQNIIHLWSLSNKISNNNDISEIEKDQDFGFFSIINLAKALGELRKSQNYNLTVVTNQVNSVTGDEKICPGKATIIGSVKVLPKEYENIKCICIDITEPSSIEKHERIAEDIIIETITEKENSCISFRGNYKWQQKIEPVNINSYILESDSLKEKGTYLITGGLGKIGSLIAEFLAKKYKANLILIGRTELPARNKWKSYLEANDPNNTISLKIQSILKLEELGSDVLMLNADICNQDSMLDIVEKATDKFGKIKGVIHLAGLPGGGLIQFRERKDIIEVFKPKIHGTQNLLDAFKNHDLDFFMMASSIASIFGSYGQVDYCAANSYIDSLAYSFKFKNGISPTVINWSMWKEAGMALNPDLDQKLRSLYEEEINNGIASDDGIRTFLKVLSSRLPQVIISNKNLSNNKILDSLGKIKIDKDKKQNQYSRPQLKTKYVAPVTEVEKSITLMWCKLFGIEGIGIYDNFLELGGHSLLATMLLNKLSQTFKDIEISLRDLFENPTVFQLAKIIAEPTKKKKQDEFKLTRKILLEIGRNEKLSVLNDYLTKKINLLCKFDLPESGDLSDVDMNSITTDLSWELRRDLEIIIFSHEITLIKNISELSHLIIDELERMNTVTADKIDFKSYILKWVPDVKPDFLAKEKNKSILFLLSSPRSGSTISRIMLGSHSKLFSPPELGLLLFNNMSEWDKLFKISEISQDGLGYALQELMNISLDKAKQLISEMITKNTPTHEVYRLMQQHAGDKVIVDKTPANALRLEVLNKAEKTFENAKYILLIRHPYSVIESFVRARFYKARAREEDFDPFLLGEQMWYTSYRNLYDFAKTLPEDRYIWVRYEELVKNTEKVVRQICSFLGYPYEEKLLNPYEGNPMLVGPGDPNIFLHDKIEANLADKWKEIKLPILLNKETCRIAELLEYELPFEKTKKPAKPDKIAKIKRVSEGTILKNDLGNLSNEEIDKLLQGMLKNDSK